MNHPAGKAFGTQGGINFPGLLGVTAGFTLMEVLVATAITGIALGVVMGLLAQGHRQAYRGDISKTAAAIATRLVTHWKSQDKFPAAEQDSVEGFDGWSYTVESEPLSTRITLPSGETKEVEPEELVAVNIVINAPGNGGKFRLTTWIPASQVQQ